MPGRFFGVLRRAVDYAMAIARWYDASVTALHVYPLPPVAAAPTGPIIMEPMLLTVAGREQLLAETRRLLEVERAPGTQTDAVIREGIRRGRDPLAGRQHAGRPGGDRHARALRRRPLVDGFSHREVLRKSRCPVLTVPPGLPDAVPAAQGAVQAHCLPGGFLGLVDARIGVRQVAGT